MKKLRNALIGVCLVLIGYTAVDNLPESTEVGTNLPDQFPTSPTIPAGARTLDPSKARPGLIATTTTATVYGPEVPSYTVIDGTHAYTVPRTPLTARLLWLATHAE